MNKIVSILITIFLSTINAEESILEKEFDCVVIPSITANLGSSVRGVISKIHVDRNDYVKKGDKLAQLDNKVEQATVDLAKTKSSISSGIELANTSYSLAKREKNRIEKAYKKGIMTAKDMDFALTDVKLARIKVIQAQEKKELDTKELARLKAVLSKHTITAPFSGVIMDRYKGQGEYVSDDVIVRLAQLHPLHVEVIMPIAQHSKIKKGMKAQICGAREEGTNWIATVSQVDKVMDVASGTFGVRLILPNKDYKITAGLQCDLKFLEKENEKK